MPIEPTVLQLAIHKAPDFPTDFILLKGIEMFAKAISPGSPSDCIFYHTMELPRSGLQPGHWDLRGRFDDYVAYVSLDGRTVLDVGTASGFLTFESERRGGKVVSVDASSAAVWDRMPFLSTLYATDYERWLEEANSYLNAIKRSYWLSHTELNSSAAVYYGSVYDLPPSLGEFDVVLVGQLLVHLRDAIRAIASIAKCCRGTMVIAEGMIASDEPVSYLLPRSEAPDRDYSFWHHSIGFYRELMKIVGFEQERQSTAKYKCNLEGPAEGVDITTLVFRRLKSSSR